jgi:hypothetical protein
MTGRETLCPGCGYQWLLTPEYLSFALRTHPRIHDLPIDEGGGVI